MTASQRMWKREQERKRRERLRRARRRRNCALVVILLAVLAVIVVISVSGKDGGGEKHESTPVPQSSVSDSKAVSDPYTTTRDDGEISESFFADSAFAGNALAQTIGMYGLLNESDFYADVNLTLENVYTVSPSGSTTSVAEQFKSKRFKKVFFAFGENELSAMTSAEFKKQYNKLIGKIEEYQPNAKIYLIGIPPVTAEVDATDKNMNSEKIAEFNRKIMSIAADREIYYIDSIDALGDNKDFLPSGVSSDGINLNRAAVVDLLYYSSKKAYIPDVEDLTAAYGDEDDDEENDTDENLKSKPNPTANPASPSPTVNILKDSATDKKNQ